MERWLGAEQVEALSRSFLRWPGPPVALGSVPGNVYVTAGGEFIGRIAAGAELTHMDLTELLVRRAAKRRFFLAAHSRKQLGAFANLQAALDAASGGKNQTLPFRLVGATPTAIGESCELWTRGVYPLAGAAGAAAPGGTVTTNASTGALPFVNPPNANTSHFVGGQMATSALVQYLLIDQLFRVAKTMNSTATEAVTGVPTRYQSGTATAGDYIGGNFCYPAVPTTVLPATAHNWTVCQYTNQASTAGQSFASTPGVASCVVGQLDIEAASAPQLSFFMPLASGDVGVKALTQMQCSALVATGTVDFVVAHPIGMISTSIGNQASLLDCLTTAMSQLNNVYDNACLTFLDFFRANLNAASTVGAINILSE